MKEKIMNVQYPHLERVTNVRQMWTYQTQFTIPGTLAHSSLQHTPGVHLYK